MLEDCNDLQLRNISKYSIVDLHRLFAVTLEILTCTGYDLCDRIRAIVDVVTNVQQRKCDAVA